MKVAVRVRPLSKFEDYSKATMIVRMKGETVEIVQSDAGAPHKATFDHAFWSCNTFVPGNRNENAPQEVIYTTIGTPMLQNTFEGYNSCLFAYGQTGSGKTYTVMGNPTDEGIAPRMGQDIFQRVKAGEKEGKEVVIEVSFLEIYNEKVRDLLNPDPKGFEGKKLRVREHPKHGTFVEGLSHFVVTNARELHDLAATGTRLRTRGTHGVFMIRIIQTLPDGVTTTSAFMLFVDIAASCLNEETGEVEEGESNQSLDTFNRILTSLSEGKSYTSLPYRDSMLTWILKDTLGGNSMTTMLATISPASNNYEETLSTLRYAECAKRIKRPIAALYQKAKPNTYNSREVIAALEHEIQDLKEAVERLATSGGDDDGSHKAASSSAGIRGCEEEGPAAQLAAAQYLLDELQLFKAERRARTRGFKDAQAGALYAIEQLEKKRQLEVAAANAKEAANSAAVAEEADAATVEEVEVDIDLDDIDLDDLGFDDDDDLLGDDDGGAAMPTATTTVPPATKDVSVDEFDIDLDDLDLDDSPAKPAPALAKPDAKAAVADDHNSDLDLDDSLEI